jgi:hypothetical protein
MGVSLRDRFYADFERLIKAETSISASSSREAPYYR